MLACNIVRDRDIAKLPKHLRATARHDLRVSLELP